VEVYRKYHLFNQAVRVLVDFMYYSRGTLSDQTKAYPPSYAYMINSIRWKIQRDQSAKAGGTDG
ncbi:phage gp6-like head-tail connector protein, partial [Lacticaseibacillus paracasei]|nr:phage gp6-like head-tail connector protein [Lacticaseibacillus paracasei]